jgi:iron(III) transport system substrate-binding protein
MGEAPARIIMLTKRCHPEVLAVKPGVLLAALVVLALAGTISAAPEGRVTVVCSVDPDWCDLVKTEFPRATGVQLDDLRLSTGEALARLRAERQNPAIDVWFGGTGDPHLVAAAEGITEFYRPGSWRDLRPELTRVTDGKYIPLYTGLHGLGINEAVLTEKRLPAPERWTDLANPGYKGLVVTPNPGTSGTGYLFVTTLVQIYGEDRAFDLLKRVHRNVAEYTRSGGAPSLLVARGEAAIGVSFGNDVINRRVKGFRIRFVAPADGVAAEIGGLSLVKGAPRRDQGVRFIEWALTPQAQMLGQRAGSFDIPSNSNTPVAIFVPRIEDARVIRYDYIRFGTPQVREHLVRRWSAEVFTAPR